MKKSRYLVVAVVVAVALSISAVSAAVPQNASYVMTPAAQTAIRGGMECDTAIAMEAGFALGALTPCSIICAVGGWYGLAAVAYAC